MRQAALMIALAAAACLTGRASAHHSTAEFDYGRLYVVRGVVKEFQWSNPHAWVRVLVPNTAGEMQEWGFELGAPSINVRMGWTDKSVAAGDKVTVLFCPSRAPARGTLLQISMDDTRPDNPYLFLKSPSVVVGANDDVVVPRGREEIDWECEFAVVIGRAAKDVPVANASNYIFGYSIEFDVSDREGRGDRKMGGGPIGSFRRTTIRLRP